MARGPNKIYKHIENKWKASLLSSRHPKRDEKTEVRPVKLRGPAHCACVHGKRKERENDKVLKGCIR